MLNWPRACRKLPAGLQNTCGPLADSELFQPKCGPTKCKANAEKTVDQVSLITALYEGHSVRLHADH